MKSDKLPLPRKQVTDLALRAHSALNEFCHGSAMVKHWESLVEVLNTVNALMCLGKLLHGVTPEMTRVLYLGLRFARCSDDSVGIDVTMTQPMAAIVTAYDVGLRTFSRKTIAQARCFVDRCVAEQTSMDIDAWFASFKHPPMLTEAEWERFRLKVTSSGSHSRRAAELVA